VPPFFDVRLYNCLDERHCRLPLEQVPDRAEIRHWLSEIDSRIRPQFRREWSLHAHWRVENLTCHIDPNLYNSNRVTEVYLRYGKTRQEVHSLRLGEDDEDSMRKHLHIAIGLAVDHFFFQLAFHREAFLDYNKLCRLLGSAGEQSEQLFIALRRLGVADYTIWPLLQAETRLDSFQRAADILSVLPAQSQRDDWLVIRRNYPTDDPLLFTDRIVGTCLQEIAQMYPVFDRVAVRSLRDPFAR
jgi:hypothetical protein